MERSSSAHNRERVKLLLLMEISLSGGLRKVSLMGMGRCSMGMGIKLLVSGIR